MSGLKSQLLRLAHFYGAHCDLRFSLGGIDLAVVAHDDHVVDEVAHIREPLQQTPKCSVVRCTALATCSLSGLA